MLVAPQLESLVQRLAPCLQGIYPADQLKVLLDGYNQAYPELELTDELDNCLRPGTVVSFTRSGLSDTSGYLVVAMRRSTQTYDGVKLNVTHGIVQLSHGRHIRVAWEQLRHTCADNHGPGAAT